MLLLFKVWDWGLFLPTVLSFTHGIAGSPCYVMTERCRPFLCYMISSTCYASSSRPVFHPGWPLGAVYPDYDHPPQPVTISHKKYMVSSPDLTWLAFEAILNLRCFVLKNLIWMSGGQIFVRSILCDEINDHLRLKRGQTLYFCDIR